MTPMEVSGPVHARVLALVERYGWNATAFQTLEPGYSYLFDGDDACVAYVDTGRAWVAAGAPIAPPERIAAVTHAFVAAARAAGRRAALVATEERLVAAVGPSLRALRIGEQPVWDPRAWPARVAASRTVREQLRRARRKGVTVRQATAAELEAGPTREAIAQLIERWLATREMAPLGFLVHLDPFSFATHRRCFVAEVAGRVVGFAGVVPVPARGGWFIEDLLRDARAPNGTSEFLVDAVMQWAGAHGSEWLTLGVAPLAGEVPPLLRVARRARVLYDFDGLRRYKAKLQPDSWTPVYLSVPARQPRLLSFLDVMAAFSGGGLLRFALRSILRGPRVLVGALAALLVPWTILVMLAPPERWFGAPWVKWGWVLFDAAVAAALFRFLRRPTLALVTGLAVAATGDALLTALQTFLWNAPRARGLTDALVLATACLAPTLAAVLLWGTRAHRAAILARNSE